ncbi:hypothetical protein BK133_12505 [Paenibacillus sp. FSL H8-0548]|uniref:TniQ family protein n=1 Tax=Paenibacillus sp. FSL H8-0548 TaxID=1920422 RepID=UPI00096CFDA4|nr:TniQ family protein [Paenibacillus sp. FSL H8-0548]OMF34608.1 hypothetical protein BK133_12505 [Paenibacillus sp. FSL H8-0548]
MEGKLGIRPAHIQGECLSSYLMRISKANNMNVNVFFRALRREGVSKSRGGNQYLLDLYPNSITNVKQMGKWIGQSESYIERMTFQPLIRKLYSDVELLNFSGVRSRISKYIIKDCRRYCPDCLKDGSGYQLLWQIAEIDLCEIHLTKLLSDCPICFKSQPYFSEQTGLLLCDNKLHDLHNQKSTCISTEDIMEQKRKYEEWRYLLDPDTEIFPEIKGVNKEVGKAVILMYISQSEANNNFSNKQSILTKLAVSKFKKMICQGGSSERIGFERTFEIIRKAKVDIRTLSSLSITDGFIASVCEKQNKYTPIVKKAYDKMQIETLIQEAIDHFLIYDLDITITSISSYINVSKSTISVFGFTNDIVKATKQQKNDRKEEGEIRLRKLTIEYLDKLNKEGKPVIAKEVLKIIGLSFTSVKERYPELWKWILEQAKSDKEKRRAQKIETYKKLVHYAALELLEEKSKLRTTDIISCIGESYTNLKICYPEIIDYIKETKANVHKLITQLEQK